MYSLYTLENFKFQKFWQEFNHKIPSKRCVTENKRFFDLKESLINKAELPY